MSQQRLLKLNSLIAKELAGILLRELDVESGVFVTVTRVHVTSDLLEAQTFVSIYPEKKRKDIMKRLTRQVFEFQKLLNKRLRMRPVPKIVFAEDFSVGKAAEVEKRLAELDTQRKESEV